MRPNHIVITAPFIECLARLRQRCEQGLVQEFVAQALFLAVDAKAAVVERTAADGAARSGSFEVGIVPG